jgi:hypothetical protein
MRLGAGPAASVATAIPDLDVFRGSFGGKDVFPLYRDADGTPNASTETLDAITKVHRASATRAPIVTPERLMAYCYAVLAGADYTERFADALETPGPRIPLSADPGLFQLAVEHGELLLWLHTYGERCTAPDRPPEIPRDGAIAWTEPITRIPEDTRDFRYDEESQALCIADGRIERVSPDVWHFEVSGMPVVKKWLGYRTQRGTGRAASSDSPLDQIRPEHWTDEWTEELLDLLTILQHTIDLLPEGTALLDRICAGATINADDLPAVPAALRKPPAASWQDSDLTLDT